MVGCPTDSIGASKAGEIYLKSRNGLGNIDKNIQCLGLTAESEDKR